MARGLRFDYKGLKLDEVTPSDVLIILTPLAPRRVTAARSRNNRR